MQTLVERGCGLDVHQASVVACLLIVLKNGGVHKQMRTFGTTARAADLRLSNTVEALLSVRGGGEQI
jgi:hypothetical protein